MFCTVKHDAHVRISSDIHTHPDTGSQTVSPIFFLILQNTDHCSNWYLRVRGGMVTGSMSRYIKRPGLLVDESWVQWRQLQSVELLDSTVSQVNGETAKHPQSVFLLFKTIFLLMDKTGASDHNLAGDSRHVRPKCQSIMIRRRCNCFERMMIYREY